MDRFCLRAPAAGAAARGEYGGAERIAEPRDAFTDGAEADDEDGTPYCQPTQRWHND